ncbi:MAG: S-methyl-5-thioribose-1-phosphate isomerase [Armatimonadota bacterium]
MQRTVDYKDGKIILIDQTKIPKEFVTIEIDNYWAVADAIQTMKVRGAPAIGVTAALGMALAAHHSTSEDAYELLDHLDTAANVLRNTRPTAVNLFWGIDRMLDTAEEAFAKGLDADGIRAALNSLAVEMLSEDEDINKAIGRNGAELLPNIGNVLTHCNAGALACVAYGTALGVIRAAIEIGKKIHVYSDETRPRLQGMKLTCFELIEDKIPVTLISDNMAGYLMKNGEIQCVVVGADRIAANGDTANKIGTYSVAVLAKYHKIPFYVAAPISTIDFSLSNGDNIPIEERDHTEVTHINGIRIAPEGVNTINPAFDLTPAELITAIITEKGVIYPPYELNLKK